MMASVLAIMDSQLTPSAIQIRAESSSTSVDILLEGTSAGCDAQAQQITRLVSENSINESDNSVWGARERLFTDSPTAAVCKVSLLAAELGIFSDYLAQQSQALQFSWALVTQAVGVGLLRLEAGSVEGLRHAVTDLRKKLESTAGSVVVLQCPLELKTGLDVWGSQGDTLPLMKNIKARFDPAGVLNPGRFVGAI